MSDSCLRRPFAGTRLAAAWLLGSLLAAPLFAQAASGAPAAAAIHTGAASAERAAPALRDGLRRALAVQAPAATAVTAEEAATQVMDFGERVFPGYFPQRSINLELPPFLYRYYPATGIYLGVVMQAGMGYTLNGIYVMGGPFGDTPVFEGMVTDYVTPQPSSGAVETKQIPGYPHSIDFYQPSGGAARAVIFLHGGGGKNYIMANDVGLNSKLDPATTANANWSWLDTRRVLAVFPQGQSIPAEPGARTWSNGAMTSGQDDVAFLKSLAAYVRANYGVSRVSIVGHSMGGAMVNRLWCEAPTTFDNFISVAGPLSSTFATSCAPAGTVPRYYGIFAGSDGVVMQEASEWEDDRWTVMPLVVLGSRQAWPNDVMMGEWQQFRRRAMLMCGATPQAAEKAVNGKVESWSACDGRMRLQRVLDATHPMSSIQTQAGAEIIDLVRGFIDAF